MKVQGAFLISLESYFFIWIPAWIWSTYFEDNEKNTTFDSLFNWEPTKQNTRAARAGWKVLLLQLHCSTHVKRGKDAAADARKSGSGHGGPPAEQNSFWKCCFSGTGAACGTIAHVETSALNVHIICHCINPPQRPYSTVYSIIRSMRIPAQFTTYRSLDQHIVREKVTRAKRFSASCAVLGVWYLQDSFCGAVD